MPAAITPDHTHPASLSVKLQDKCSWCQAHTVHANMSTMPCCRHLECVTYLLSKGADVMATNPKGETCLHIAAKNGHSNCVVRLLNSRINTPGAATRLADLVFTEGLEEVKYVDLHNLAGMTALHVAALNGSAVTVQALLASGASLDAQITGSNLTPWLSRGSTALHIAAARGFHAVVDVLLSAQTSESGEQPAIGAAQQHQ